MNQYAPLEQYEKEFIEETYSDPSWSIAKIANKLERCAATIMSHARKIGLKRPVQSKRMIDHDWPSIWYAHQANQSYGETGRCLGIPGQVVAYAIPQMILMGTERRLALWNRYADIHGRERYTFEEANGMV